MSGSVAMARSGYRSTRHRNLIHDGVHHDIYTVYSDINNTEVEPILDAIRREKISVYDPYNDGMPQETKFKAWLDRGIHMAKLSLIFLTKASVKSNLCRYQSDHAAMHYVKTKGRHRVVLVMLESCRIPKNLRQFHCVFAWQHREDPVKQHKRILTAIVAPKPKFRRGSLIWTSANTSIIPHKTCHEIPCLQQRKPDLKNWELLLNVTKIKHALQYCEIKCSSDNCTFRCDGVNILNHFVRHIKECKYQQVLCSFCKQPVQRKNLQRHEEKSCRLKPKVCQNEGCGKKMPAKLLRGHSVSCPYREETCPNEKYGCSHVFARKDRGKHLEICDYEKQQCKVCHETYFRVDIDSHSCISANKRLDISSEMYTEFVPALYKCRNSHCTFVGTKTAINSHKRQCVYRIEQCPVCGLRLPVNELIWHKKLCDKLIECELCHLIVPSSSKVTHDRCACRGQNMRSMCEKCRTWICYGTLESHQAACNAQTISEDVRTAYGNSASRVVRPLDTQSYDMMNSSGGDCAINVPPTCEDKNDYGISLDKNTFTEIDERYCHGGHSQFYPSPSTAHRLWTKTSRQKWRELMN